MLADLILGTAGHIDHGKTSLIGALTGIETDRLPEEKKRGITIELGYAHLDLPPFRLGIVDVPGHEKFVRQMLAGATGMDLAMLVVAGDDSIKQQTREHLDILRLLNLPAGVIALTKCDLVDPDWLTLVEEEIRSLVSGSFLESAVIVRTSSKTREGLDDLKLALTNAAKIAAGSNRVQRLNAPFRMAIDRAFTIDGHGTVVTGSVGSGTVHIGDQIQVQPGDHSVRVRGIQNHDSKSDEVHRGQRAAINLAGIHHNEIDRGHELCAVDHLLPSQLLTAEVNVLGSEIKPLKDRQRIRFHIGTAGLFGNVRVLGVTGFTDDDPDDAELDEVEDLETGSHEDQVDADQQVDQEDDEPGKAAPDKPESETQSKNQSSVGKVHEILPGQRGVVQIFLNQPAAAIWNQPFVIRRQSPVETIGGGNVLHPNAGRLRKPTIQDLAMVRMMADSDPVARASAAIYLADDPELDSSALARTAGVVETESVYEQLKSDGRLIEIRLSVSRTALVHKQRFEQIAERMIKRLNKLHDKEPLRFSHPRQTVEAEFAYLGQPELLAAVIMELKDRKQITIKNAAIGLVGRGPKLSKGEKALLEELVQEVRAGGLKPNDAATLQKNARKNRDSVPQLLSLAVENGDLARIDKDIYYHSAVVEAVKSQLQEAIEKAGGQTISDIRQLLDISRKYAVPLCEYLDSIEFTRRDGDARVLV